MYGMNGGAQCVSLEIAICQERTGLALRMQGKKTWMSRWCWDAGSQKRDWRDFYIDYCYCTDYLTNIDVD